MLDVDTQQNIALNTLDQNQQLKEKALRMEWYLYEQTHDLYDFYYEKLSNEVLYGGHIGLEEYLMMLSHMDEENMKDWEKRMMAEIRELRLIKEDVIALGDHLAEQAKVIVLPEWIQDPQIKQEAYQLL